MNIDSLRDGRSIRTVSALLLQLVQTSVHDVRQEASRIARARQHSLVLHRVDSFETEKDQTMCVLKIRTI